MDDDKLDRRGRFLTKTDLEEWFAYDSESGEIRWIVDRSSRAMKGDQAGCEDEQGYRTVRLSVDGFRLNIRCHDLAWVLHYGEWPQKGLDHINRKPSDNRISNLRECDPWQNQHNTLAQRNNSHGSKGLIYDSKKRKWRARISIDGRRMDLGWFREKSDAETAYIEASRKHAGDFSAV